MTNPMTKYNVPGGQLAISYQGRLLYNRGFGFANTETKESISPKSIFRIASVSKTITSIACMKLFEQGLLNLDAKVFGINGITQYRYIQRQKEKEQRDTEHPQNKTTKYFYGGVNLEKGLQKHLPFDSVVFTKDQYNNPTTNYAPPWLYPAHLKLDYGIIIFKALGVGHDFVKVETNKQTKQTNNLSRQIQRKIYFLARISTLNQQC